MTLRRAFRPRLDILESRCLLSSTPVVIGLPDSGVDIANKDLYLHIAINQGEIPPAIRPKLIDVDGDNYIDFHDLNDPRNSRLVSDPNHNGYIDGEDLIHDPRWVDGKDHDHDGLPNDLVGWNYVTNTNDPSPTMFHGTAVAGILAADAPAARILPVTVIGSDGAMLADTGALGILFSVLHGANVVNVSWGNPGDSPTLLNAISWASAFNAVVVAAAGNNGSNNDVLPSHPADYQNYGNVISVAATDVAGNLTPWSNYGLSVTVAAPGLNITSLTPGGGQEVFSGTSFAAPVVAALVANIKALRPKDTAPQLVSLVKAQATPVPSLAGKVATSGVILHADAPSLPALIPPSTQKVVMGYVHRAPHHPLSRIKTGPIGKAWSRHLGR
jgi:subtilisin family serine protease